MSGGLRHELASLTDSLQMTLTAPDGSSGSNSQSGKRSSMTPGSPSGRLPYRELLQLYESSQDRLRKVSAERDELATLASQRQDAFLRSEAQYREDVRALQERLKQMGVEDKQRMEPLRTLQSNIHDTIHSIQDKTARILQDQERDLIRAFRARLQDLSVELDRERKKNESGAAEWVARCRKLTEELEWMRDLTDKLTAENKAVLKDNRRFKRQMKTQEEDREFLIKQLVAVKKENARLRYSFDQLMAGKVASIQQLTPGDHTPSLTHPPGAILPNGGLNSSITGQPVSQTRPLLRAGTADGRPGTSSGAGSRGSPSFLPSRPQSAMVHPSTGMKSGMSPSSGQSRPGTAAGYPYMESQGSSTGGESGEWSHEKERRYKQLLSKMQRQLDDLQSRYRSLKNQHTQEMVCKNELQDFLKKCIDDVRNNIAERARTTTTTRVGSRRATGVGGSRPTSSAGFARKLSSTSSHASSTSSLSSTLSSAPPMDPRQIPLSEFTPHDRINVMEWLMSQDQVIFQLYEMIFPRHGNHAGTGENSSIAAQQRAMESEMSRLASSGLNSPSSNHSSNAPRDASPSRLFSEWSSGSPAMQGARQQDAQQQQQQQPRKQHIGLSSASNSRPSTASTGGRTHLPNPRERSSMTTGSQYERPLGSRPLSGIDAKTTEPSSLMPPSLLPQSAQVRPQTVSSAGGRSSSSGTTTTLPPTSPSTTATEHEVSAADIEDELRRQREQRARERGEHGNDDDDEDETEENEYGADKDEAEHKEE